VLRTLSGRRSLKPASVVSSGSVNTTHVALPFFAFDPDIASVFFDKFFAENQAKAKILFVQQVKCNRMRVSFLRLSFPTEAKQILPFST